MMRVHSTGQETNISETDTQRIASFFEKQSRCIRVDFITRGKPFIALSSKNLDGLKKSPYTPDHLLRVV